MGQPQDAVANERRGVVVLTVWVADEAAVAYAERRWGDVVELKGLLHPA